VWPVDGFRTRIMITKNCKDRSFDVAFEHVKDAGLGVLDVRT
jgi:hypothetical protein